MNSLVVQRMKTGWAVTVLALLFGVSSASAQEHRGFASAEEAVTAMVAVLEREDRAELGPILGPGSEGVVDSGDAVADAEALADFLERYKAKHTLVADGDTKMVLQVGENDWPLPIPLVEREGKWYFDGAAGAEEIVYRRVGRNELGAIAVCRGFVDAQTEYASQGHDGNEPGIYAAKLMSDPQQQNGLYWPTAEGEPLSPAGPAVADAAEEGYRALKGKRTAYHGYYYRMLFAQGTNAGGGAMEYFADGLLTQGVALLAWPAEYGVSGVKSFMINHDGVVYEKDLGEETGTAAESIQLFDPDSSWSIVEPEDAS
jgi:hypothetical protein